MTVGALIFYSVGLIGTALKTILGGLCNASRNLPYASLLTWEHGLKFTPEAPNHVQNVAPYIEVWIEIL